MFVTDVQSAIIFREVTAMRSFMNICVMYAHTAVLPCAKQRI